MQIGKQDQAGAKMRVLGRLRLLDLDNQIGLAPDFGRGGADLCACVDVFLIWDGAADAGLGFHQDAMAGFTQPRDSAGNESDACFVILDFLRDADCH